MLLSLTSGILYHKILVISPRFVLMQTHLCLAELINGKIYNWNNILSEELYCSVIFRNKIHINWHINATFMNTIGSDEIVGHLPGFRAQVLPPMMWSGEIVSVDVVCMGEPNNLPKGTWVLARWIKIPCIYEVCGYKEETKY